MSLSLLLVWVESVSQRKNIVLYEVTAAVPVGIERVCAAVINLLLLL